MESKKMNIEMRETSTLIPYEKNTKKHDEDQVANIAESIRQYGFVQPIVIDAENVVVIGHGRLLEAKKLKMPTVPCVRVTDLTPDQIRALRIVDNKSNESEWDLPLLGEELSDLDLSAFNFDWGLEPTAEEREEVIEDEPPPIDNEVTVCHPGDIWQLGRHRLMCGDSTRLKDVAALAGGAVMDLLLTDPPYGVSYEGGTGLTIKNDSLEDDEFTKFLTDAYRAANAVMRPSAVFYIWHADSRGLIFRLACNNVGWKIRECLVWVKNSLVLGRQDYQWRHEPCLAGETPDDESIKEHDPCLYGWKDGKKHTWNYDRKQTTVLEYDKPAKNADHPTMKPVKMFAYQIQNSTYKGDNVLDLFGGSGTTLIAAEQVGRTAFLMEYDPKYADVIIKRYVAFTGDKAVFVRNAYNNEDVEKNDNEAETR